MNNDNKHISAQNSSLSIAAMATQSLVTSPTIKSSLKSSGLYLPKKSNLQARNHDSMMAGNASFGKGGEQAFSIIEDRLLPSFTGPGFKGTVEEMNQLTRQWLASSRFDVLMTELYNLLKSGMISLTAKLAPTPDEFLPSKAAEIWTNFYGNIVPNIQAALLPLRQLKKHDSTFDLRNQILCSFKSFVIWPMKGRLQGKLGF
jgi:HbrB-like